MPNTPKGLTYPSNASPVAVPADLQELATDVDGLIVPNTGGTYTGSVSFTQSPSVPTPTSSLHAVNKTYADAINTDVTALETELGTNPSGTFSTVVQRLDSYTDGFSKVGNLLTDNQASGGDTLGDATGFGLWGGATYERTTATAASGTGCLKVNYTSAGAGDACTIRASVGDMIAVKAGETITLHVKVKQGSGTRSRAQLWGGFFDESNIVVAYAAQQRLTVTSSFQSIYNTVVVPAGATRFAVVFGTPDTGADTDYMYFDEFGVWKGSGGRWALPGVPIPGQSRIAVNNAVDLSGTGTPEGVITAAPGSTWLQTDSTTDVKGWIRWIKATGTGNTGWVVGPEADTGWRRIVAWAGDAYTEGADIAPGADWNISGAGAGYLLLRRQGTLLSLVVYGSLALVSSPTGVTPASRLCALPTGFGVGSTQTTSIKMSGDTVIALEWGGVEISRGANTNYPSGGRWLTGGASLSALTDTAWPTSLPGVAP